MPDKKTLLQKFKSEWARDAGWEVVKSTIVSPILLWIMAPVTAIALTLLAYWSQIDPLFKLTAIVVTIYFLTMLARRIHEWVASSRASTGHSIDGEVEALVPGRIQSIELAITSGRLEAGFSKEFIGGKDFFVVRATLRNRTSKTLRGVVVSIDCRTWDASARIPFFEDAKSIRLTHTTKNDTLNPEVSFQFIVLAKPATEDSRVIIGDPGGNEQEFSFVTNGSHFVTVTIASEDQPPVFKNMVIVTENGNEIPPYVSEFDNRAWGRPQDAPDPYTSNRRII